MDYSMILMLTGVVLALGVGMHYYKNPVIFFVGVVIFLWGAYSYTEKNEVEIHQDDARIIQ